MIKEIAVLIGVEGESATLYDSREVVVYQKRCRRWHPVRSLPFVMEEDMGLPRMRARMKELIDFLAECRAFSALSVCGLPYFELEKAGFTIWEMGGRPADFLQIIGDKYADPLPETEKNEQQKPAAQEISPGRFLISLKEVQAHDLGRSSKQILLPILKQEFQSLEILCDHLPPWLETMIMAGEIQAAVDKTASGETRIYLKKLEKNRKG